MRIAVTGGTGFIGRHVVKHLQDSGLEPTLVGRAEFSRIGKDTFERLGGPDVLLHLAWGGLPNYHATHHFEDELPQHYQFLKRCIASGLRRLVVAGTCSEYGMQSGALSEHMVAEPVHAYSLAKNALRQQLECLRRQFPFEMTWGRIFYPYGEGQGSASLLNQLKQAVERGEEEFKMSAGEQLRDFLAVEEVARILVSLARIPEGQGIVNIGSGSPTSVRRLVENWLAHEQKEIRLHLGFYPYPSYEPMAFWADTRKLTSCLGQGL